MSKKMGRRTFMKSATSAFLGLAAAPVLGAGHSYAKTGKSFVVEYRTLRKTGLKLTAVGMGVLNCSDPAVLLRAYDLGVNFFDTERRYMGGKNEEMVGKAFRGKQDKVLVQTKVRAAVRAQLHSSATVTAPSNIVVDCITRADVPSEKRQTRCHWHVNEGLQRSCGTIDPYGRMRSDRRRVL
jgi:hypothetical protein